MIQKFTAWAVVCEWSATKKWPREFTFMFKSLEGRKPPLFMTKKQAMDYIRDKKTRRSNFLKLHVWKVNVSITPDPCF